MALEIVESEGGVCFPTGFLVGAADAGIRKGDRDDLALIFSERPAAIAGVFTQNAFPAWSVVHGREVCARGAARAIVCNAGNANACTGEAGKMADLRMAQSAAGALNLSPDEVVTASTGVIGRAFPIEKAEAGIRQAAERLARSAEAGRASAVAIMTTDLVPKTAAVEVRTVRGTFRIGGIAKGSGMIAPNMATMLGFLTTDASIPSPILKNVLVGSCESSFNRISVDSDTSTNDLVYLLANGASGIEPTAEEFGPALDMVATSLAKQIARDGEGATKLVEVVVFGDSDHALSAARSIADSPLVKTALFGNDPNWGRIVMALGKSGARFDPLQVAISIAGFPVFRKGLPLDVDLDAVSQAMKAPEVVIEVSLDPGALDAVRFWTCDFSYDYVKINAEYTT